MTSARGAMGGVPKRLRPEPETARQSGATLVVALVLLLVLTVLGVATMDTAIRELTMASSAQFLQDAFEGAEAGIELALGSGRIGLEPIAIGPLDVGNGKARSVTTCVAATPMPDGAFSYGPGGVQAFHFEIVSVGTAPRNAVSTHHQSFYVAGPFSENACPRTELDSG